MSRLSFGWNWFSRFGFTSVILIIFWVQLCHKDLDFSSLSLDGMVPMVWRFWQKYSLQLGLRRVFFSSVIFAWKNYNLVVIYFVFFL